MQSNISRLFSPLSAVCAIVFFFFSSRRRHTRCLSDWSSDVCSSDLHRSMDASAIRPPTSSVRPTRSAADSTRSEEHTSELQSLRHLVCRLLLEKKKETVTATHQ